MESYRERDFERLENKVSDLEIQIQSLEKQVLWLSITLLSRQPTQEELNMAQQHMYELEPHRKLG